MLNLRAYATPLTIGTFLIAGVTGVLMFFHLSTGLNKVVHEWIGLGMVAAIVLHVVLNWRAFKGYFKRPVAMSLIAGAVVILGLSFMPTAEAEGGRPDFAAIELVNNAPLTELAPLLDTDAADLVSRLATQGVTASEDQSLSDLAGGDGRQAATLLAAIRG